MKKSKRFIAVMLVIMLTLIPLGMINAEAAGKWVTSWTTSMVQGGVNVAGLQVNDIIPSHHTVRTELSVTTGGSMLRFKFSNQYGTEALVINEVTVAKTDGSGRGRIKTATVVPVTFDEKTSVTIARGDTVWSDAIPFETAALEKISVSMYFNATTGMKTVGLSNGKTYLNQTNAYNGASQCKSASLSGIVNEVRITSGTVTYHTVPFLCAIESLSPYDDACTAVFIGDSTLVNDTYYYYAQRIVDAGVKNVAVVNQAIIGNRLLSRCTGSLIGNLFGPSTLERFQRDVLGLTGVKYCFVKIGINDIIHQYSNSLGAQTPKYTTDDLIAGYNKLINYCHKNGIKIYFFTKSGWKGYSRAFLGQSDDLVWSEDAQAKLDALTKWVKTTRLHDGYIDCSPLTDPRDYTALCSTLTIDGAHLTNLGSIALADQIPLSYVGASGGRRAAQINGVNPYAERDRILYEMEHPTTAPATTAPATTKPAATTTQPATTKPATTTAPATTAQAAENYTIPVTEATTVPVTDYTMPSYYYEETSTAPVIVPGIVEGQTNGGSSSQDVEKIGTDPGGIVVLLIFVVIIVAGAIVLSTVLKKKEPDYSGI